MIKLAYFLGASAHLSTDAYVVPFRATTTELASIIHGEWLQSLPYMEHFMQLIKHGPLGMNDGDIFITQANDPKDNVRNVIFVRNDLIAPRTEILLPALQETLLLRASTVTVLFEAPDSIAKQQEYAFQLFMVLMHFAEDHDAADKEIRVNFPTTQSHAYQIFQEQGVPFLGIM